VPGDLANALLIPVSRSSAINRMNLHVPSQVVVLDAGCVVLTMSRGYGRTFAEAAPKFALADTALPT